MRLLEDSEGSESPGDQEAKRYSLSQLRELQNKLMLITAKTEQSREEANRFLEVSHSTASTSARETMAVRLRISLELLLGKSSMTCSPGLAGAEVLL